MKTLSLILNGVKLTALEATNKFGDQIIIIFTRRVVILEVAFAEDDLVEFNEKVITNFLTRG